MTLIDYWQLKCKWILCLFPCYTGMRFLRNWSLNAFSQASFSSQHQNIHKFHINHINSGAASWIIYHHPHKALLPSYEYIFLSKRLEKCYTLINASALLNLFCCFSLQSLNLFSKHLPNIQKLFPFQSCNCFLSSWYFCANHVNDFSWIFRAYYLYWSRYVGS